MGGGQNVSCARALDNYSERDKTDRYI